MPQSGNEENKEKDASFAEAFRELGPYMTIGFQLAAAVVGFFLLGYWLDNRYNSSPWLSLLGLVLGATGGFIKFFRTVATLENKKQAKKA